MKKVLLFLIALLILPAAAGCTQTPAEAHAEAIPFVRFEKTQAFSTIYPAGWEAVILETGIIVFAPQEVFKSEAAGPSLTVYRDAPADSMESPAELLDHFLELGPLREGFLVEPSLETEIDGVPGLTAAFSSTSSDLPLQGCIAMVRLENNAVYYFVAAAPRQQWDQEWFYLEQIIHQTTFNEN